MNGAKLVFASLLIVRMRVSRTMDHGEATGGMRQAAFPGCVSSSCLFARDPVTRTQQVSEPECDGERADIF
jgi:hypothetical protein